MVQEAIDRLISVAKCTVVLVAHRLRTVINADNILVVDKGKIVESGTHAALLERKGIYAKLVERQVANMRNTFNQ